MRREIWDGMIRVAGIAAAVAVFLGGWSMWWIAVEAVGRGDARERREIEAYGAEVRAPRREAAEAAEETEPETGRIEIYREGDGPAPAWYRPDEAMAAEWSAADDSSTDGGRAWQSDGADYNASADWMLGVPLSEEFQIYLHGLCEEAGVPYVLAVAVIEAESTYREDVISSSGDWGLMQINRVCHAWLSAELGISDFLDPYENARAGVYILGGYYRLYGAESGTLVAYNMGQAAAEQLFAAGIYETDYSRRVAGIRYRLETEGA